MKIFGLFALPLGTLATTWAAAQEQSEIVITARPLPGALDPQRLPASTQSLDAEALKRGGTTNLLRAADTDLAGITLDEAQANPYQPTLLYRGYEASALGGDAQGLAIYLDGARFNQPFGDATNWDLIASPAVEQLTLEGSNPVFGLNALGGALAIDLKTGRSMQGVGVEAAGWAFGRRELSFEAGLHRHGISAYLTGSTQRDEGWRDSSSSKVSQLYAQFGADGAWGHADLRFMGAESNLYGNGTAPVELLAVRRESVFTYPDQARNRYGRALLSADVLVHQHFRLRPSAYVQLFHQPATNGDLSDAETCAGDTAILCLDGDDAAPVTGTTDQFFSAFNGPEGYAQLNNTCTRTLGYGAAVELESDGALVGRPNRFSIGFSYDGSRTQFDASSFLGVLGPDRSVQNLQGIIDMVDGPIRPVDILSHRDDIGIYLTNIWTPIRASMSLWPPATIMLA